MTKDELVIFLKDKKGSVVCNDGNQTEEVCLSISQLFQCNIGRGYYGAFDRYLCPCYEQRNGYGEPTVEGNNFPKPGLPHISYEEFMNAFGEFKPVNAMDVL